MRRLIGLGIGIVLALALASCNSSSSSSGDVCTAKSGPGGLCSTIQVCCAADQTACYVLAAGKTIKCPADDCAAQSVLTAETAACTVPVDGDAEAVVDGDQDTAEEVVDGDTDEPVLDGDSEAALDGDTDVVVDGDTDVVVDGDTETALDGDSDSSVPASHTDNQNGVMHNVGKTDPLKNCTGCHGAALKGGSGPSCYTCHNNDDHTSLRGGEQVPHKSGGSSTCNVCHGPSNKGGLGPACSTCH